MTILSEIDAAIREVELRGKQLLELRELAIALDGPPRIAEASPRPPALEPAPRSTSTSKKRSTSKRRAPAWSVEEAIQPIRQLIADRPRTHSALIKACGKSMNTHTRKLVRQALEQLGAVETGDGKWTIEREVEVPLGTSEAIAAAARDVGALPETNGSADVAVEVDRACLERALLRELQKAPATVSGVAEVIDAPESEVELAVERLIESGHLSGMANGMVVG